MGLRGAWIVVVAAALATRVAAQQFHPPSMAARGSGGTRLGLFGFGVRAGADVSGKGQAILGAALDIGSLGVDRVRLRPSMEIGILHGANSYAASFEIVYRFAPDNRAVVPYWGAGLAVAGHAGCGNDPGCPSAWVNVVLGFEVRFRSTFNWLVEFHPMDAFRHNRFYLGLTTRRGN